MRWKSFWTHCKGRRGCGVQFWVSSLTHFITSQLGGLQEGCVCWAYCGFFFFALSQIYIHESKFLTKSLFSFLWKMLHAPAYPPSCTQIHHPPSYPDSLHCCSATGWDLMELSTLPLKLPVESQSAETGKGLPPHARSPVEIKWGARHGGSWPFQAITLIPLIWAWVSLENTATVSLTQLWEGAQTQRRGQARPAIPPSCEFLKK